MSRRIVKNRSTNPHDEEACSNQVQNTTQTLLTQQDPAPSKPKVPLLNFRPVLFDHNKNQAAVDPLKFPSVSNHPHQSSQRSHTSFTPSSHPAKSQFNTTKQARSPYEAHPRLFNQTSQPDQSELGLQSQDGSFVDLGEQEDFSAKLHELALQLGEASVANDMAALVSQKRDIELERQARKTALSGKIQLDSRKAMFQMRQVQSTLVPDKQLNSSKRSQHQSVSPSMVMGKSKPFSKEAPTDCKQQRVRTILLNMICLLFEHYSL